MRRLIAIALLVVSLPLATYLITFVICFNAGRLYVRSVFLPLALVSLATAMLMVPVHSDEARIVSDAGSRVMQGILTGIGFLGAGVIVSLDTQVDAELALEGDARELTRFIQPPALSSVLNRVTGGNPSLILGSLQSNGRVLLINPNGIVFGAGAQIDVAGLVIAVPPR